MTRGRLCHSTNHCWLPFRSEQSCIPSFRCFFTLMCSSCLIISVSFVHVSLIREKTNEPDANRDAAVDKYKRYFFVVFLYELTTGTMDITRGDHSMKYCRNMTLIREEDIYRSEYYLLSSREWFVIARLIVCIVIKLFSLNHMRRVIWEESIIKWIICIQVIDAHSNLIQSACIHANRSQMLRWLSTKIDVHQLLTTIVVRHCESTVFAPPMI